MSILNFEKVG